MPWSASAARGAEGASCLSRAPATTAAAPTTSTLRVRRLRPRRYLPSALASAAATMRPRAARDGDGHPTAAAVPDGTAVRLCRELIEAGRRLERRRGEAEQLRVEALMDERARRERILLDLDQQTQALERSLHVAQSQAARFAAENERLRARLAAVGADVGEDDAVGDGLDGGGEASEGDILGLEEAW
mmetsp:Transcript_31816/g.93008  ORF Transcript_31816/g.93008 Transcript_31816/m.93008 type:complete len:188 (-) Transcript_31816:67-630(-)